MLPSPSNGCLSSSTHFKVFSFLCFFALINRDARNLWFKVLCKCHNKRKANFSTTSKHTSTSGNTASTKVSSQQYSSGTLKAAVKKEKFKEDLAMANYYASYTEDSDDPNPELNLGDLSIIEKSKPAQIKIKRSSSIQNIHDIETAVVIIDESELKDEETSL